MSEKTIIRFMDRSELVVPAPTLQGWAFDDINLHPAILENLILDDASFRRCNMRNAFLDGSSARSACFDGANLVGASLRNANLALATFRDSQLLHTNFEKSVLSRANFSAARIHCANFTGSDLRGACLLDVALGNSVFADAVYDEATVWPIGFDPVAAGLRQAPK